VIIGAELVDLISGISHFSFPIHMKLELGSWVLLPSESSIIYKTKVVIINFKGVQFTDYSKVNS
jgi:hypothetical protein